jgi:hypothetical protein
MVKKRLMKRLTAPDTTSKNERLYYNQFVENHGREEADEAARAARHHVQEGAGVWLGQIYFRRR